VTTFSKIAIGLGFGLVLILTTPIVCRKYRVPLVSNGKVIAIASRPLWYDETISSGKTNLFSLSSDLFELPLFIYPFADGKRFLTIYDDDIAILVFVVDFDRAAGRTNQPMWPKSDWSKYLADQATKVVIRTEGLVRLPDFAELQEVSSNLAGLTPGQYRAAAFPCWDLGILRSYWPKERLLDDLATNRASVWP
jgi:hypothetical protein